MQMLPGGGEDLPNGQLFGDLGEEVLYKLKVPDGRLSRAADPGFALVRPFGEYTGLNDRNAKRSAAVELSTGPVNHQRDACAGRARALLRLGKRARGRGAV
jgi:hypothetical protein